MAATSSYVCDTLPAARLATTHCGDDYPSPLSDPPPFVDHSPMSFDVDASAVLGDTDDTTSSSESGMPEIASPPPSQQPPPRKLCFRHQRMADEGTNLKLQQSLDALPLEERETVNAVWSNFSSSSHPRRALILQGLLTMCCFSQLSLLTEHLAHLIRIDPFTVLPREVSLKVLSYLDATSLCRAAQVSRLWKDLADDDVLWRGICEQHIGQKCQKCGWGLPILEKMRAYRPLSASPSPSQGSPSRPSKRTFDEESLPLVERPSKRQRSESAQLSTHTHSTDLTTMPTSMVTTPSKFESSSDFLLAPNLPSPRTESFIRPWKRPWKDVYSERLGIERNWRRGRCTVRTLKGHNDGVMCLQFNETLSHPAFPVLITGSYDRTARVWNLETGVELHCLKGHTRAVRALQFDEVKLITGSMDHTVRVWDWRQGRCIRTLTGHTEGVVCLNFDSSVLASGSVDTTIKVWNLRTGGAFTLRGHRDWVNSVQLWDSNPDTRISSSGTSVFDVPSSALPFANNNNAVSQIDPGKMLFSASDDGTIKLWDLNLRTCVRQFTGHVGQVQSMKLLLADDCSDQPHKAGEQRDGTDQSASRSGTSDSEQGTADFCPNSDQSSSGGVLASYKYIRSLYQSGPRRRDASSSTSFSLPAVVDRPKPNLISGSLDNTIKLWDIDTGKTIRTFFGHIEGVWAVASDKLRLVSGSHDRTIKVWSREEGRCLATLVGHRGAVTCLALGEDKIVSGSDDGDIKIWSFSG